VQPENIKPYISGIPDAIDIIAQTFIKDNTWEKDDEF